MRSKSAAIMVQTVGCAAGVGILAMARGSDYFGWALGAALVVAIVAICASTVIAEQKDPAPAPERIATPEALEEAVQTLIERLDVAADRVDAIRTDDLDGTLRGLIERLDVASRGLGGLAISTSSEAEIIHQRNQPIMRVLDLIETGDIDVEESEGLLRVFRESAPESA